MICALLRTPHRNLNFPARAVRWFLPRGHCQCQSRRDGCSREEAKHTQPDAGSARGVQLCWRGNHRRRLPPLIEGATQSCRCTPLHIPPPHPGRPSSHKLCSRISASCLNPCKSQQLPCLINPPRDHPTRQGVRVLPIAPPKVQRRTPALPLAPRSPSPLLPHAAHQPQPFLGVPGVGSDSVFLLQQQRLLAACQPPGGCLFPFLRPSELWSFC